MRSLPRFPSLWYICYLWDNGWYICYLWDNVREGTVIFHLHSVARSHSPPPPAATPNLTHPWFNVNIFGNIFNMSFANPILTRDLAILQKLSIFQIPWAILSVSKLKFWCIAANKPVKSLYLQKVIHHLLFGENEQKPQCHQNKFYICWTARSMERSIFFSS